MAREVLQPIHPGEILLEESLVPLRLARFFGTSDRFWLNLQTRFDPATNGLEGRHSPDPSSSYSSRWMSSVSIWSCLWSLSKSSPRRRRMAGFLGSRPSP